MRTGSAPEPRGLRRFGDVLAAVVVLEGATVAELRRSCALAAALARRCILVAVDGGLRTCRRAGRRPDLLVGDGDSSRGLGGPRPPSILLPRDKDHSDFAGALAELRRRKVQIVCVAGLLGGRVDHEWANLFELAASAGGFAGAVAPTARGTVIVTRRGCRLATARGRTCSLFCLGSRATVTLRGTRWELRRQPIRPGSLGLSNMTGVRIDLTVHRGVVALLLPRAGRAG